MFWPAGVLVPAWRITGVRDGDVLGTSSSSKKHGNSMPSITLPSSALASKSYLVSVPRIIFFTCFVALTAAAIVFCTVPLRLLFFLYVYSWSG